MVEAETAVPNLDLDQSASGAKLSDQQQPRYCGTTLTESMS